MSNKTGIFIQVFPWKKKKKKKKTEPNFSFALEKDLSVWLPLKLAVLTMWIKNYWFFRLNYSVYLDEINKYSFWDKYWITSFSI